MKASSIFLTAAVCHAKSTALLLINRPIQLNGGHRRACRNAEQLVEEDRLIEDPDDGAVLGGDTVSIWPPQPPGAGHVLRHHAGIAGENFEI